MVSLFNTKSKIGKFFLKKKKIKFPKKSAILIYDINKFDKILNLIEKKNFEILNIRNEINLIVLLICLIKLKFKKIDYIEEYIKLVDPKIVFSLTDNDTAFYEIKKRYRKELITVAIQSGWRTISNDLFEQLQNYKNKSNLSSDWILTFNETIAIEYKKYISTKTLAIGNIANNENSKDFSNKKLKDTILLISQWVEDNSKDNKILMLLFGFLKNYADKKNKKLGILLRKDNSNEKFFFKSDPGENFHFINRNNLNNSYYWIDRYETTVTIDSTLGYESLSRGNKTIFFNIRSNYNENKGYSFGWPNIFSKKGIIWTDENDINYFEKILNNTFQISDENFKAQIEKNKLNNLMLYDKDNLLLKNFLKKIFKKLDI
jgi:surface carbohydrate biosynthesis protein